MAILSVMAIMVLTLLALMIMTNTTTTKIKTKTFVYKKVALINVLAMLINVRTRRRTDNPNHRLPLRVYLKMASVLSPKINLL